MVCNARGGIMDDIFIYRMKPHEYLLCVNASNREKITSWLLNEASGVPALALRDDSEDLAQLALRDQPPVPSSCCSVRQASRS